MDSRSDFQILQRITIPMIYRLFVFIFRYWIVFNIIRKPFFFSKRTIVPQIRYYPTNGYFSQV